MADPANTNTPDPKDDPIQNLKAEMSRKFENSQAELKKLQDTNTALAAQLRTLAPKAPPEPKEPALDQLFYADPDAHAAKIKEMTKKEMREEFRRDQEAQSRRNSVINQLGNDYPEFNDHESELTQKTLELYGKMDEAEKKDPKAIRIAALEAAQELGVKPKSKRGDDESFSFGGNSNSNRPNARQQRSDKLDSRTEDLASLMGIDLKNPKAVERLKKRAERKNYRNYQSNK